MEKNISSFHFAFRPHIKIKSPPKQRNMLFFSFFETRISTHVNASLRTHQFFFFAGKKWKEFFKNVPPETWTLKAEMMNPRCLSRCKEGKKLLSLFLRPRRLLFFAFAFTLQRRRDWKIMFYFFPSISKLSSESEQWKQRLSHFPFDEV